MIVGIIEAAKRADPNNIVVSYVWFYTALALGMAGSAAVFIISSGVPTTLESWAAMIVLGLNFGLAAGAAYDKTIGK